MNIGIINRIISAMSYTKGCTGIYPLKTGKSKQECKEIYRTLYFGDKNIQNIADIQILYVFISQFLTKW